MQSLDMISHNDLIRISPCLTCRPCSLLLLSKGLINSRETEQAVSTFPCRSPAGHVNAPDLASDGHPVERSRSGSAVRISGGLPCLGGEFTFSSKALLFLKYLPYCPLSKHLYGCPKVSVVAKVNRLSYLCYFSLHFVP